MKISSQIQLTIGGCRFNGVAVLLMILSAASVQAGSTADRIRSESGFIINPQQETMINAMPSPDGSVDDSGSCRNSTLSFANSTAKTGWQDRYGLPLSLWAIAHAGNRAGSSEGGQCNDMEFAARLWQSTIGSSVTGQLSEHDVNELVRIIDASNPMYVQARRTDAMTPQERSVDMYLGLAERGDAKAQFRLGNVYEKQGNLAEAERWYQKAADQGFPLARNALENLRVRGGTANLETKGNPKGQDREELISRLKEAVEYFERGRTPDAAGSLMVASAKSTLLVLSDKSDGPAVVDAIVKCEIGDPVENSSGESFDLDLLRAAVKILKTDSPFYIHIAKMQLKKIRPTLCPKVEDTLSTKYPSMTGSQYGQKDARRIETGGSPSLVTAAGDINAENFTHPLLDYTTGATAYRGALWNIIGDSGVPFGQGLGGAATLALEAALKKPKDRSSTVYFPNDPRMGEAVVGFTVPPQTLYRTVNIPFCLGQTDNLNGKNRGRILLSGEISLNGEVYQGGNLTLVSTPEPSRTYTDPERKAYAIKFDRATVDNMQARMDVYNSARFEGDIKSNSALAIHNPCDTFFQAVMQRWRQLPARTID